VQLNILIVEPGLDEAMHIHDAIAEAAERRCFGDWVEVRTAYAPRLSEIAERLEDLRPDAVLFNPSLPGETPMEAAQWMLDRAPDVPMIAILEDSQASLGPRLIREGAEDFIVRSGLDCEPLAHALCASIERHRWTAPARVASSLASLSRASNTINVTDQAALTNEKRFHVALP
jgi:DNA-binding NarL/FixJ family response regulator